MWHEIRDVVGESIDLPDNCADAVISSLVLCTVSDPRQVVSEVRRVLRPGGRYGFVEHVAAGDGTPTRRVQHRVRRPWGWIFEGCSCERDLEVVIREAGFATVMIDRYRIHSPLLPFNTQIADSLNPAPPLLLHSVAHSRKKRWEDRQPSCFSCSRW
jgi:SAM-dependent methyltransferase